MSIKFYSTAQIFFKSGHSVTVSPLIKSEKEVHDMEQAKEFAAKAERQFSNFMIGKVENSQEELSTFSFKTLHHGYFRIKCDEVESAWVSVEAVEE